MPVRRRPLSTALLLVTLLATGFAVPALGGGLPRAPGDGSSTNNGDLLHAIPTACAYCAAPVEWTPASPLDWSLSLRGAITTDGEVARYELVAVPDVRLVQETLRGGYELGASAEIGYAPDTGSTRIGGLGLDGRMTHRFDAVTSTELTGRLALSQDDPSAPGVGDGVAAAPIVATATLGGSMRRDFGPFDAEARWSLGRTLNGDTEFTNGTSASNSYQDVIEAGVGGRVSLRLAPGLRAFVDGTIDRQLHDAASPSLGLPLDNRTYALRGGFTTRLGGGLEGEASLGYGWCDFEADGLADFGRVLYGAKLTARPDETLALSAALDTRIEGPGNAVGARAKIVYAVTAAAEYRVNPWLGLRGSAGWSQAHLLGADLDEFSWSAGAGLDYRLSEQLKASLDYGFTSTLTEPVPAEAKDEHRLSVGLTLSR